MTPVFAFDPIVFLQLALALALGMLVGAERTVAGKSAGVRTYGLVAMGSALFVVIAGYITPDFAEFTNTDPLRVMASVITGMGFLGAGLIIFQERKGEVTGLTTAAGLWVAAGIGIAVGYQLYALALSVALLTLVAFTAAWRWEEEIRDVAGLPSAQKPRKKDRKKTAVKKKTS